MRKPKISFLIPRLGITDRGAEILVYELARRLSKDFEIVIWVRKSKSKPALLEELVKCGITIKKITCIPEKHWLAHLLYVFPPLRNIFDKFHVGPTELEMLSFSIMSIPELLKVNFDILFPVNGVWGAVVCRLIRVFRRTPFVYTSVGGIEPLIARQKPDMYFTINPGIKRWLNTHFPKLRVEFISTGVDLKKFSMLGNKASVNLPRPVFLTVSALIKDKRVDLTIKALALLKRGSLLIVGEGPFKSELMLLAEKYLGKDRFLFQSVRYNRLPEFYRAADVFAFSAPKEVGWGMVHLEALASGLPVVANKEENIAFLMGKQEFLCDVENIEEYSICLDRASKKKTGSYWRNKVKNYSWEKVAKKYKDLLLEVLSK